MHQERLAALRAHLVTLPRPTDEPGSDEHPNHTPELG